MHELGITQEIIAIVCDRAGGATVRRVVLEVGKFTLVAPEALRFCFDVCSAGTLAEGAALDIIETAGRARCRACGSELTLEQPLGRCACGSGDLEWLAGDELKIKEMEVSHV
jgi:hydrogenase nickel incorporation protein HypA/HybF